MLRAAAPSWCRKAIRPLLDIPYDRLGVGIVRLILGEGIDQCRKPKSQALRTRGRIVGSQICGMGVRQGRIGHLEKQLRNQGDIPAELSDRELSVAALGANHVKGEIRKLRHAFHGDRAVVFLRAASTGDLGNLLAKDRDFIRLPWTTNCRADCPMSRMPSSRTSVMS